MKKISRQLAWQREHKKNGLCVNCGESATSGIFCEKHVLMARRNARTYLACTARMLGESSIDEEKDYYKIRKKIAKKYAMGKSSVKLARKYGITAATILRIAREYGKKIRHAGRPRLAF